MGLFDKEYYKGIFIVLVSLLILTIGTFMPSGMLGFLVFSFGFIGFIAGFCELFLVLLRRKKTKND